jgi:hypothetical protein
MKLIIVASVALMATPAMAFVTPSNDVSVSLDMIATGLPDSSSAGWTEDDAIRQQGVPSQEQRVVPSQEQRVVMSKAIPFLGCPAVLKDCDLSGNVGFDPLGFAKNKEQLWEFREAEIKHARLAMLVRTFSLGLVKLGLNDMSLITIILLRQTKGCYWLARFRTNGPKYRKLFWGTGYAR